MNSAYHRIPEESRVLLESAVTVLQSPLAALAHEEIVLMIYNLGRVDGRIQGVDCSEALVREVLRA